MVTLEEEAEQPGEGKHSGGCNGIGAVFIVILGKRQLLCITLYTSHIFLILSNITFKKRTAVFWMLYFSMLSLLMMLGTSKKLWIHVSN